MRGIFRALSFLTICLMVSQYFPAPVEAAVPPTIGIDDRFANHAIEGQIVSQNLDVSPPQVKIMVKNPHRFWTNLSAQPHFASTVKPADWTKGGVNVGGIYAAAGVLIGGGEAVWDWQPDLSRVRSTGVSVYVSPAIYNPDHTFTPAAGVLNVLSIVLALIGQTPQWGDTPKLLDIIGKLETSQKIVAASRALDEQDAVEFVQDFYEILNDPQDVQILKDALEMVGVHVSTTFLKKLAVVWTIADLLRLTGDVIFATITDESVGSVDFTASRPFDLGLIAYTGLDGNIWVVNSDGSDPKRVTSSGTAGRPFTSPHWSSDGSLLAFAVGSTGQGASIPAFGIVQLADGTAHLVQPTQPIAAPFAFFPDGKHVAAVSRAPANSGFCQNQLVSVDLASGTVSPLIQAGCRIWSLQVAPDGKSLLITSGGSDPTLVAQRVPIPSGPVVTLPHPDSAIGPRVSLATLSPDGAKLAYFFSGTDPAAGQNLQLAQSDGAQSTTIYRVPPGEQADSLTFSPEHLQVTFGVGDDLAGHQIAQPELWVVGVDGTNPNKIGVGREPAWQPTPFPITGSLPIALAVPKAPTATAVPTTTVVEFHPAGVRTGPVFSGQCWTRSTQLDGADRWRCQGPSGIADPCFSSAPNATEVICEADPTTDGRGIRVVLASPLPVNEPLHQSSPLDLYVVQLADGSNCWFSSAGPLLIADTNQFVRNRCGELVSRSPLTLWALVNIKPGPVWTADKVELAPAADSKLGGMKIIRRQPVTLAKVWK